MQNGTAVVTALSGLTVQPSMQAAEQQEQCAEEYDTTRIMKSFKVSQETMHGQLSFV